MLSKTNTYVKTGSLIKLDGTIGRQNVGIRFLIDSGAIDYAKNKAEQFIAAGKRDLQALAPSAFRNILHDITDQILNRSC